MKGLILSGGRGTRLRPLTHTNAKQLIPIANKPILFYAIETLSNAGIKDIGIVVGDTKNEIKTAVGDGKPWGVKVTYIDQPHPLGLAHAVKISEPYIGKDNFVMYLGDNLVKDGINDLVKKFDDNKPTAQILLAHVENPQQFGVATLSGDKVVKLVEKPKVPESDLALVGVYMFDNNIFEAVNRIKPSARNELEITDAIQYLIDNKFVVTSHIITGWWKDTGKLDDLLEANRLVLDTIEQKTNGEIVDSKIEGRVVIDHGAKIINSTVRGPSIIGANTIVKDSFIGPYTSIYFSVNIESSEIEHSIILENSKILKVRRLADSLIGQNVEIKKTDHGAACLRIMVGDSSKVELI